MKEIARIDAEIKAAIKQQAAHYRVRNLRMRRARLLGTHTEEQWQKLCAEFDQRCVKCGQRRHLDKDHIIPVYQGGSDGLSNIQPLCAPCNAGKGRETVNWAEYRRHRGFELVE